MTKKRVLVGLIILLLIAISYIFIQFNSAKSIQDNCLMNDFDKVFEKENSLQLNEVYDFSKILNCKSWDEIIIVGGDRVNRAVIFLKEGVALPKIDYNDRISGVLLFYLIKDGKLISPPLSLWQQDFLYFENFNYFDYVSLDKEDVVFKCVKLKPVEMQDGILTFEMVEGNKN